MKAKLIKLDNNYFLKIGDTTFATSATPNLSASIRHSISLKNCQAIERGYDLDDLVEGFIEKTGYHDFDSYSYKLGFQKALELMGDKKFTISDLKKSMDMSRIIIDEKYVHSGEEIYQSLQQNEWEVIVEMEPYHDGNFVEDGKTHSFEPKWKPKLDVDGCLILKRV